MSKSVDLEILAALQRERQPTSRKLFFAVALGVFVFLILGLGLPLIVSIKLGLAWWLSVALWSLTASIALFYFLSGTLRVEVPGYWTPLARLKTLVAMSSLTLIQLVTCPHLTFLDMESKLSIPIFEHLMMFYMSFGSHRLCEFLCGVTFSLMAGVLALLILQRTTSVRGLPMAPFLGLSALALLPLFCHQWLAGSFASHAGFWLLGSIVGLSFSLGLTQVVLLVRKLKTEERS